jgi:hypothetical protein
MAQLAGKKNRSMAGRTEPIYAPQQSKAAPAQLLRAVGAIA